MSLETAPAEDTLALAVRMVAAILRKTRWLVVSTVVVGAVSAGIIVLLPQTYTSDATVLVSENASQNAANPLAALKESGLGSILSGISSTGSSLPELKSLLATREMALWAVRTYRLDSVWSKGKSLKKPMDAEDQVKNWNRHFSWEESEFSDGLKLAFESPTPALSRTVVEGSIVWLDSAFRGMARRNAAVREHYLAGRVQAQLALVDSLQDSLAAFQIRHRIVAPVVQVEGLARGAADLEIEAEKLDLQVRSMVSAMGANNSTVQQLRETRDQTRAAARRLLARDDDRSILKGMASGVEAALQVQRMQRQIQVQGAVYGFLTQQKEQIGLDISKDLPSLSVIDPPLLPKKRTSPPRRLLFQSILVLWVLGSCTWIVLADALRRSPPSPDVGAAWSDLVATLPAWLARRLG